MFTKGFTLSWTAATDDVGVTGYDIYNGATLTGSTTEATTYAATGLTPSTSYSYTVLAKDAAGNVSAASTTLLVETAAAATSDTEAPTVPINLASSGITNSKITLSWTAASDNVGVTGYDIYNGTTKLGSTTGATSYTVTGLTPETAYSFTVKARDAAGNVSAASAALVVKTFGDFGYVVTPDGTIAISAYMRLNQKLSSLLQLMVKQLQLLEMRAFT